MSAEYRPDDELWIEKYRPKKINEVVGQDEIVERLEAYVKTKNVPHLMFAGPAGTGKTTCALALAKELYSSDWKQNFNELNASDERGINIIRGKIDISKNRFSTDFYDRFRCCNKSKRSSDNFIRCANTSCCKGNFYCIGPVSNTDSVLASTIGSEILFKVFYL